MSVARTRIRDPLSSISIPAPKTPYPGPERGRPKTRKVWMLSQTRGCFPTIRTRDILDPLKTFRALCAGAWGARLPTTYGYVLHLFFFFFLSLFFLFVEPVTARSIVACQASNHRMTRHDLTRDLLMGVGWALAGIFVFRHLTNR